MLTTISVEEAQAHLKELIGKLGAGEEMVITQDHHPVAKLVGEPTKSAKPRPGPGLCKGSILFMAPDFDAPLEDFKEYME